MGAGKSQNGREKIRAKNSQEEFLARFDFFPPPLIAPAAGSPSMIKTESNDCFIIHCFKENDEKRIMLKSRPNQPCSYFAVGTTLHHP